MAKQKCTKCKEKFDNVLCQCCQTKQFVDNGLLMYMSSYMSRAPRLAIRSSILNFYSADEVASARQVIEDSVKDIIFEHPAIGKKRTDSSKRTACDAMVDDILDFLSALDRVEDAIVPKFVCSNARGLPPAGPEDGGSLMTVLEAVAAQQRQMKQIQESMNEMRSDLIKLQTKDAAVIGKTASSVVANPSVKDGTDSRVEKGTLPLRGQRDAAPKVDQVPSTSRGKSTCDGLIFGSVQNQSKIQSSGEEYQHQVKRPNKGSLREHGKTKKQTSKGGTSESDTLLAGPSKFQVQITNVNSDLNVDDIKTYLRSKETQAVSIEDKTSPGWETKRYLLTFSYEQFDKVLSADFWPKKIYFKRWFPAIAAKANNNSK